MWHRNLNNLRHNAFAINIMNNFSQSTIATRLTMFIIDAHLDLSMNALEWNRDLTLEVAAIREREKGLTDKPDRGRGTVSLPELRRGGLGLVVATQIARFVAPDNPLPGWHSAWQAWAQTQGQLAWYKAMEAEGEMVMIKDLAGLERHASRWMGQEEAAAAGSGEPADATGADRPAHAAGVAGKPPRSEEHTSELQSP